MRGAGQVYLPACVNPRILSLMKRAIISTALLCLTSTFALAAGDPEAGAEKAYTCTGCHGIPAYMNVYPTYHVPKIGGQNYEYIVAALKAYRNGERQHPTMTAQASRLDDQAIEDIAAYFVSLSKEQGAVE